MNGDLKIGLEVEVTNTPVPESNANLKRTAIENSSSNTNKKAKLLQNTQEEGECETGKEATSEELSKNTQEVEYDTRKEVTSEELRVELEVEVADSNPADVSNNKTPKFSSVKKNQTLPGMKADELRRLLVTDHIKFCQDVGLMAKSVKCTCNQEMRMYKQPHKRATWKCAKNGHSVKIMMRKGTWFEGSKQDEVTILFIAYMWVHQYSFQSMLHECGMTLKVLNEWLQSCVDLCQAILEAKGDPIGGENKSVELFDCKLRKEKWIFCALEINSTNSLMIFLEDKAPNTITKIFDKYFLPGTTVISRVWSPYDGMTANDFNHLTREKSLTFYDLVTQMKMDTFKEFEKKTSRVRPKLEGKLEFDEKFFEKMYRRSLAFAPDAYLAFLKDIALIKKPCTELVRTEKVIEDEPI